MNGKELIQRFHGAEWPSPQHVELFVEQAGRITNDELSQLLEVLSDRRAVADSRAHGLRRKVFQDLVERSPNKEWFSTLVRAIPSAHVSVRALLVHLAVRCNNVLEHADAVQLLWSTDSFTRRAGFELLTQVRGRTAFQLLVQYLGRTDFPGRIEAMDALVTMGGFQAIPGLQSALHVGTEDEKLRALHYLGKQEVVRGNSEAAIEAIRLALHDSSQEVVTAAIQAFGGVADEGPFFDEIAPLIENGNLHIVRAVMGAMGRFDSDQAVTLLRLRFRMGPRSVRLVILETLEQIGNDDVLTLLADALDNHHLSVRMKAAEVLQHLAAAGTVDLARTVLWLLRSRDVNVKRIAADVARSVDDTEGRLWPQLLRFLRDEDWWVRERITDALVEMAGTNLTRHVASFLQDESAVVRRYGVDMLMRLKDPASLGALVRSAANDEDWWVRERCVEAMGLLKDPRALPYLSDLMVKRPDMRLVTISAIAELDADGSASHVVGLLADDDPDIVHRVLSCLNTLNDRSVSSAIEGALLHSVAEIRVLAAEILHRWHVEEEVNSAVDEKMARNMTTLDKLLYATAKANADDLILSANRQPYVKRLGAMQALAKTTFTADQVAALLTPLLSEQHRASLERREDVDFSYEVKTANLRFRANIFHQYGGLGAVFRTVNTEIPDIDKLQLPDIVKSFGDLRHGLVLIGGPTGSGKSTTLAAIISYINNTYPKHIITLEDPIEVVHETKRSLINQREVGVHTPDFASALRATLREDPDVILVGEMRDLETIGFAITAAETGHLVFGTVHTTSADTSVDRIINAFPSPQHAQVRSILANSLRAVCCQHLLRRKSGEGRVAAVEVMVNTDAVANLIRKGKTYQIPMMVATQREHGMQSMDNELLRLVKEGVISAEVAYMKAVNKKEFDDVIADREAQGTS